MFRVVKACSLGPYWRRAIHNEQLQVRKGYKIKTTYCSYEVLVCTRRSESWMRYPHPQNLQQPSALASHKALATYNTTPVSKPSYPIPLSSSLPHPLSSNHRLRLPPPRARDRQIPLHQLLLNNLPSTHSLFFVDRRLSSRMDSDVWDLGLDGL